MASWRDSARQGVLTGTVAALASAGVLVLAAAARRRPPLSPLNGPSQWFWGRRAARTRRVSWDHTALGFATHHASAVFWAILHEQAFPKPRKHRRVATELRRAATTAAVAAFVDYALTPRRLQPGFEQHVGIPSLVATYAAFAVGLAAGRLQLSTGGPMQRVEKTIEVDCPVRTVYNQWTQFEDFPHFMAGVKEVQQIDDTHLRWNAEVWGKDEEWIAEITEQTPDERISWRSTRGARNAGTVRFEPVGPDRTRVRLVMAYEPEGVVENVGAITGAMDSQVQASVEDFKKFIEKRRSETGAWRGTVQT
jgi:uncharacterized membrane protein